MLPDEAVEQFLERNPEPGTPAPQAQEPARKRRQRSDKGKPRGRKPKVDKPEPAQRTSSERTLYDVADDKARVGKQILALRAEYRELCEEQSELELREL